MADPIDLSRARILVSNDDGIDAPGIKVLEEVARSLSDDVWVVAPESEQSAVAHSLTIRRPLRLRQVGERRYCVDGTSTDSVLLGVRQLLQERRPDLVLSGINRGSNLGDDVSYSGTVAAAMEGALLGVRSIALSQMVLENTAVSFEVPERFGADLIRRLVAAPWPTNVMLNINFPAVSPDAVNVQRVVRHGRRKLGDELRERFDPRGRAYFWIGPQRSDEAVDEDTDMAVVESSGIAVTPICLDLTHYPSMTGFAATLR